MNGHVAGSIGHMNFFAQKHENNVENWYIHEKIERENQNIWYSAA